jgi:molybdopterin-guanine dinucleotide biosynthesis protein A
MTLTTMLLAGGLSRRMGRDKATLTIGGLPLWQRQLQILQELAPTALWVSARSRPIWCPAEIEVLCDEPPSRGPLSGVAHGLRRLETSHLLVLAVDLPQITSEHLRVLWSLAAPGRGVIPVNANHLEPLCAVYPASASGAAQAALRSSDVSLQSFVRTLAENNIPTLYPLRQDERSLYLNINQPADLRSAC